MITKVINIRNSPSGFRKTDGIQFGEYIYIGRPSMFGNPVKISGKFGTFYCPVCREEHKTAGSTLECFEKYFRNQMAHDIPFRRKALELKGKTLVCFCKPKFCHGDIIAKVLEEWE